MEHSNDSDRKMKKQKHAELLDSRMIALLVFLCFFFSAQPLRPSAARSLRSGKGEA